MFPPWVRQRWTKKPADREVGRLRKSYDGREGYPSMSFRHRRIVMPRCAVMQRRRRMVAGRTLNFINLPSVRSFPASIGYSAFVAKTEYRHIARHRRSRSANGSFPRRRPVRCNQPVSAALQAPPASEPFRQKHVELMDPSTGLGGSSGSTIVPDGSARPGRSRRRNQLGAAGLRDAGHPGSPSRHSGRARQP